jgi:hypothetical protein
MGRCMSIKKKGSSEQCKADSVLNSDFCGRHSKVKTPIRWTPSRTYLDTVVLLQSMVRRFLIKRLLRWGGPGVLSRKDCINDEELVTFDSKGSVHPLDYFGWSEGTSVWWMSVPSILQLFRTELTPVNPYSREPFSDDARARIRHLMAYRMRNRLPYSHGLTETAESYRKGYFILIYQFMMDHGYDDFHPESWNTLTRLQMYAFMEIFARVLTGWSLETPSRRFRVQMASHARRIYQRAIEDTMHLPLHICRSVGPILLQDRSTPDIAFFIASARHQTLLR